MGECIAMEEDFDFSGENDRRKEARRISKDRRDMIRYEKTKDDRRSAIEQRKVKAAMKEDETLDVDDEDNYHEEQETALDTVIGKISKLFGR